MNQIPTLSVSWLTDRLRLAGVIGRKVAVSSFKSELLTGGLMADTLRLSLQYSDGNGAEPKSIVAKLPSSNPDSRAAGHEMACYSLEINFYKNIADQLSVSTPRCYHASIDEATSDFTLLLEDLTPAFVADENTENAKELMLLSLSELALLHGKTMGRDNFKAHVIGRKMSDKQTIEAACAGWDILKRVADHRLPRSSIALGDRLIENTHQLPALKNLRSCLVHGDYRFPNFLYRGNTNVFTVDWQTYDWTNPGIDLAHLMICSVNLSQTKDWFEECVQHYHSKMLDAGVQNYSIDDCYYDFKVGVLFDMQFMMATTFAVGATQFSDAARDQLLNACEKIWTFADELNALDILK